MAQAEDKATTAEQDAAYSAALEREREGYEARLKNAKAGRRELLTEEELVDRIAQVDAELKRVKPAAKPAKASKASKDAGDGEGDDA